MKKLFLFLLSAGLAVLGACAQEKPNQSVLVEGGAFVNTKSGYYGKDGTISDFYIGKYEVTQKEWADVMGSNPSQFKSADLPVEMVSWYDCIEYCNKRSIKEGLKPFYRVDTNQKDPDNKNDQDPVKWTVTVDSGANGYRLPTEAEWEYAADGGRISKNYTYSGSNDADDVAWYWKNDGDKYLSGDWSWPAIEQNNGKTKSVGKKEPNELGLYDMSGNIREWCWDWYEGPDFESGFARVVKGGGWIGDVNCCESSFRGKYEPYSKGPDQGFRVCRNG